MPRPYFKIPLLLIVYLIFTFSLLFGCERSRKDFHSNNDSYLKIADYIPFTTLNPFLARDGAAASIIELLYDTLIRIDEDGEVIPHLAKYWYVSEDLNRWRFELRSGVLFHDGTELKAEDVLFTFRLIKNHGQPFHRSGYAKHIESMRIIDEYSVEFVLSEPLSTFLSFINMVGIFSEPEEEENGFLDHDFQPVGTGPYKLSKLDQKEVLFERHDEYFLGRPQIGSVIVKIMPDQETIWARLLRGEVDIFDFFGPESYHFLTQIPAHQTFSRLRPYYCMMLLNCVDPRFSDVRIRRALNLAVNKERIIEKNLKGHGRVCASTVYPLHWTFDEALHPYPYEQRLALKLFGEAGWTLDPMTRRLARGSVPFKITLMIHTLEASMPEHARSIERDLEAIGITVQTLAMQPEEFFDRMHTGEFDAAILNFCAGDEPDFNFTFWHSSQTHSFNHGHYSNPEVDRLLTAGRRTIDREERKEIYRQFQQVIHDDPPGVFLYWMEYLIAVHERFDNVNVKMVSGGYFRDIPNWTVDLGAKP